jgi:hypothetical protein
VLGVVVALDRKTNAATGGSRFIAWIDDGSAILSCVLFLPPYHNPPSMDLGSTVRVLGKVSDWNGLRQITAFNIHVELDPNFEILWTLQRLALMEKYKSRGPIDVSNEDLEQLYHSFTDVQVTEEAIESVGKIVQETKKVPEKLPDKEVREYKRSNVVHTRYPSRLGTAVDNDIDLDFNSALWEYLCKFDIGPFTLSDLLNHTHLVNLAERIRVREEKATECIISDALTHWMNHHRIYFQNGKFRITRPPSLEQVVLRVLYNKCQEMDYTEKSGIGVDEIVLEVRYDRMATKPEVLSALMGLVEDGLVFDVSKGQYRVL